MGRLTVTFRYNVGNCIKTLLEASNLQLDLYNYDGYGTECLEHVLNPVFAGSTSLDNGAWVVSKHETKLGHQTVENL
jgi:hypothetical protein